MLAGLTGLGDRAVEPRQMEQAVAAAAAVAEIAPGAVREAESARLAELPAAAPAAEPAAHPAFAALAPRGRAPVDERRLESASGATLRRGPASKPRSRAPRRAVFIRVTTGFRHVRR